MKKILALLLLLSLAGVLLIVGARTRLYEDQASSATGAIFSSGRFHCSGTEIGSTSDGGGVFLTARHCVADTETNKLYDHLTVSFSDNQAGPFYVAKPIALSLEDDLALLYLVNGASVPTVKIADERSIQNGDQIFNVSFPLGTGKQKFHGQFMASRFPVLPLGKEYPQWINSMPMNLTIAHGSSGSGVFSARKQALIGVAVGTFMEGTYNIAIPADRVIDFLNDLKDNTVTKFLAAYPEKEPPPDFFMF